jgi:hypothetical protein
VGKVQDKEILMLLFSMIVVHDPKAVDGRKLYDSIIGTGTTGIMLC